MSKLNLRIDEKIKTHPDELQAIKVFEASFEKNPILIDGNESYKKALQIIERAKRQIR